MALLDFAKKLKDDLLDKTTLDERISNAFNRTKAISPLPQQEQTKFNKNLLGSRLKNEAKGFLNSLGDQFQDVQQSVSRYAKDNPLQLASMATGGMIPSSFNNLERAARKYTGYSPEPTKVSDVFNMGKGIAAATASPATLATGAGIGTALSGIGNLAQGNKFFNNAGRNAAEGATTGALYKAMSAANPLSNYYAPLRGGNFFQRAVGQSALNAAREGVEGFVEGSLRPLDQGESRGKAMLGDTAYGIGYGALLGPLEEFGNSRSNKKKFGVPSVMKNSKGQNYNAQTGEFVKELEKQSRSFIGQQFDKIRSRPKWKKVGARKWQISSKDIDETQYAGAAGAIAGIEVETDDEGKITNVKFNPTNAALGIGAMTAAQKLKIRRSDLSGKQLDQTNQQLKNTFGDQFQSPEVDNVLKEARKKISYETEQKPDLRQNLEQFYTNWVDRSFPAEKLEKSVEEVIGGSIRPEFKPTNAIKRLLGAGGVAEQRHKEKLQPILDKVKDVDFQDLDVFLKAKRDIELAGRGIKGSDADQARGVLITMSRKYDVDRLNEVAEELYQYQRQGLDNLKEAGFISDESYKTIISQNQKYVPFQRVIDEVDEFLGLPTKKMENRGTPIKKIKGSDRAIFSPIESIISNTYKTEAAIAKNRVAKSIVGLQEILPNLGFQQTKGDDRLGVAVWNNGQKEYWRVPEDVSKMVKGLNEENMGAFIKLLSAPSNLLRRGATGQNPDFFVPNVIRDQFDAAINAKYGYTPFIDWAKGLSHLIKKDDVYQQWIKSGGSISYSSLSGRKQVRDQLKEATNRKRIWSKLGEWLDTASEYSESPTRLGVFGRALDKTKNPLIAAQESRDATIDFSRMGAKMKVANSLIPFLNVGVQAADKLARNIKNNPGKTALAIGAYGAMPSAMTTLYNLQYFPDVYSEIPDWEKESNFIIVTGRNSAGNPRYIKIAKGNVAELGANPTEEFLRFLHDKDQASFGQLALDMIGSTVPVIESGPGIKGTLTRTVGSVLPQAIKPTTENLVNRSFYKFNTSRNEPSEIVPFYLKDKPPAEQKFNSTERVYSKLGQVLNMSPLQIKNFMEGTAAGFVKTPVNITETLMDIADGKRVDRNRIPVVRRFIGEYGGKTGSTSLSEKQDDDQPGFIKRLLQPGSEANAADVAKLPDNEKDLEELYKAATNTVNNYRSRRVKSEQGLSNTDMQDIEDDLTQAVNIITRIKQQKPQAILKLELKQNSSDGSAKVADRVIWAADKLQSVEGKEREKLLEQMYENNVLTKSVVEEINSTYGLGLTKYNYGGKIKTLSGSGGRKVSIKKSSPYKIKIGTTTPSTSNIQMPSVNIKPTQLPSFKLRANKPQSLNLRANYQPIKIEGRTIRISK